MSDSAYGKAGVRALMLCLVAAALSLLLLLITEDAYADESKDGTRSRDISLTVRYETEDSFGSNVDVLIYRVASVSDDGVLTPVPALAKYPINWNVTDSSSTQALANTIEGYILLNGNTPTPYSMAAEGSSSIILPVDVGVTDANGVVVFPTENESLEEGCYLVMACTDEGEEELFAASPALVQLPYPSESGDNYDVGVSLKVSRFSLSRTIDLDVMKVWEASDDRDAAIEAELTARSQEVYVSLLCDGYIYDTVALNEANGWRHVWSDLSPRSSWDVVEEFVPDSYEVSVVEDGTSVYVVNTHVYDGAEDYPPASGDEGAEKPPLKEESSNKKLPQTGMLWWPVPLLLAAGAGCFVLGAHERHKNG